MLTVLTWRWGTKYPEDHVERLMRGVARNIRRPHRFILATDRPSEVHCEHIPIEREDLLEIRDGCYARLQMFDPKWRERWRMDEILCLDLDVVITGWIDDLLHGDHSFRILKGGHFNPCPFNGSVMHIREGAPEKVWSEFDVAKADAVAMRDGIWRGSDQTWIAHMMPDASVWQAGPSSGIWAYGKPPWPKTSALPDGARIVAFPGKRDPSKLRHVDWIRRNWC